MLPQGWGLRCMWRLSLGGETGALGTVCVWWWQWWHPAGVTPASSTWPEDPAAVGVAALPHPNTVGGWTGAASRGTGGDSGDISPATPKLCRGRCSGGVPAPGGFSCFWWCVFLKKKRKKKAAEGENPIRGSASSCQKYLSRGQAGAALCPCEVAAAGTRGGEHATGADPHGERAGMGQGQGRG